MGLRIPKKNVLLSTGSGKNKADMLEAAHRLANHGYCIYATEGTSRYLSENGIPSVRVLWPSEVEALSPDSAEAKLPRALDLLRDKKVEMVVNIHKNFSTGELTNGYKIRRAAIDHNIPLRTNARLASAFIYAFTTTRVEDLEIKSWQEF